MMTRFRTGLMQLVRFPVAAETIIAPGDLVFYDGIGLKPAADFPWDMNLATTRAAFAAVFAGVAYSGSQVGETDQVSVDLSPLSIYEADAATGTYRVGDLLSPTEAVETLSNRRLEPVTDPSHAIGRAMGLTVGNATRVRASFASAFHAGSANVNASVG
jgi:hypothetical protein